ncbi:MAG: hypothetical protein H8E79_06000 [Desulfobulbaceae bacterium]|uniref:BFD-like (2Fe-2S) protein n=1 Tax=Candidatus Desulfatifera sulfidica TaxID=2841691 RepID=A0A8J6TDT3_9BACT|nr:hypothetical protein [Candidatus Desulfatifera sulfidica]
MDQQTGKQLICYCFHYTRADLLADLAANGRSTIQERIMTEKKEGGCRCSETNPKGR